MEKTFIDLMKQKLKQEKSRIEGELCEFAKPTDKKGNYETTFEDLGRDRDENALEVEIYEGDIAMERTLEKRLQSIIGALDRIEQGTYGKCQQCGNAIQEARLEVNPEAEHCMNCAQ